MRTHLCGALRAEDVGSVVRLCGWVAKRREHGEHLAFLDLRDHSGVVQCVVDGSVDVRSEYVIAVEGTVRPDPREPPTPISPPATSSCPIARSPCSTRPSRRPSPSMTGWRSTRSPV